jgi:hypothetical protein
MKRSEKNALILYTAVFKAMTSAKEAIYMHRWAVNSLNCQLVKVLVKLTYASDFGSIYAFKRLMLSKNALKLRIFKLLTVFAFQISAH